MVEFEVKDNEDLSWRHFNSKMRLSRPKSEVMAEAGWIIFLMECCLNL